MSLEGTRPHGVDDQLNAAGNKIMSMLQQASNLTESRTRSAGENAQRLSQQLGAAKSRIEDLEAEIKYYQDRVDRAEQWLHRIYTEIEARFPASEADAAASGRH
jgi:septal ring factor EnvC (AmiA/AmiB activator)